MPMHRPQSRAIHQYSAGYTLIELLIVIMIAVLLMVITLPVAKKVMEDARPREASRILNTTFATSKSRAAQTGRLAGVEFILQRMNDPMATQGAYQCTQMYMCEVPALYAGDTTTAVATVQQDTGMSGWYDLEFRDEFPADTVPDTTPTTTHWLTDQLPLQPGTSAMPGSEDYFHIRFAHRGPWYSAQRKTMGKFSVQLGGFFPAGAMSSTSASINRYTTFQIRRPPVRVGNPVELPKSTAIDMTYSGSGQQLAEFGSAIALRLMFTPAGNIDSLTMAVPNMQPGMSPTITSGAPPGTIHFLVGLTTKVNTPQEGMGAWNINDVTKSNLADGNSLWVSIGRSTGVVTTNENAPDATLIADPTNAMQRANYLRGCRQYATAREQKGGR